jgi:hypothetical protein
MATSWKLPLAAAAAAAGEAAEPPPPPPPPAGPASPPGPARPRAQPEPRGWDGRGSPLQGGRCQLRGLLGLVVCELGGVGSDLCVWGTRVLGSLEPSWGGRCPEPPQ